MASSSGTKAPRSLNTSKKASTEPKLATRRYAVLVIALTIIEATEDFKDVLTQLKEQNDANCASDKTPEEKLRISTELTREQSAVIHSYYAFVLEQKGRIERLGYAWPSLNDLQPGPPPMNN